MTNALLLDLDDTLLHNSMGEFLPRYFKALSAAVIEHMQPEPFLQALHAATAQMLANTDPEHTNETVFWQTFEPLLTVDRATLEPVLQRFYDDVFPGLYGTTTPMEGVGELIASAKEAGWKLAVATNPVFPLRAIQHRMEWAGLHEDDFDFVTSYENMYSTKPHAQYFVQIARALGVDPASCIMAGNHLSNDLVGAAEVGMQTFWVTDYPIADAELVPDGQGSLDDLRRWLFSKE
jgi:FMN phosphatase YigB (HAD superfamily)